MPGDAGGWGTGGWVATVGVNRGRAVFGAFTGPYGLNDVYGWGLGGGEERGWLMCVGVCVCGGGVVGKGFGVNL